MFTMFTDNGKRNVWRQLLHISVNCMEQFFKDFCLYLYRFTVDVDVSFFYLIGIILEANNLKCR